MSTARAEGCGLVPVASAQRRFDSRVYSPAQCVGQLAENSAAKGNKFNATTFEVAILSQFASSTRAKETDVGVPSNTQALKALDDGVGFLYEEIEDMLTYGTPESVTVDKKFGANNHGLKAAAATLSPACCLLFSKSKHHDGSIWHTLLAFGDNFDHDGLYSFRRLAWPASFTGTTLQALTDADFFQCGSLEAYKDLFRTGGKSWATLRDLAAAHGHFREIKGTGVLGIFPFGQESNTLKAEVQDEDIKLQGVSLRELLEKYFVAPELGLMETEYWAEYQGFKMVLNVGKRKKITIKPKAPKFPVSPQVAVTVGQALHTVVYGPYRSPKHEHGLFPYAHDAGQGFHKQNYQFYLASNSRIMNPVYSPKTSDNGDNRTDYFAKQKVSQKPASSIMNQLLETLCGGDLSDEVPELYGELQEVLEELRVFDNKNPYLQKSEDYQKQMKNLKWLLGLPFEITARIDTEYLQFNDGKDDLRDDALKRDAFFASVHTAVALDVLKRMLPGFKRLMIEADMAKPDKQLKMDKLFQSGTAQDAAAGPSKAKPAKRVPKTAQQAQQEKLEAQHAKQEGEQAQHAAASAAAGRATKRSAAAAATAGNTSSEGGSVSDKEDAAKCARAARHESRMDQMHPTDLGSPSGPKGGKRKREGTPSDSTGGTHEGLAMLAAAAERPTVSRSLLQSDSDPASKRSKASDIQRFDELWRQAVSEGLIQDSELTRSLQAMAMASLRQQSTSESA